jgi:hypothetical protein
MVLVYSRQVSCEFIPYLDDDLEPVVLGQSQTGVLMIQMVYFAIFSLNLVF